MKFFRRHLHNDMQPGWGVDYETASLQWKSQREAYRRHLANIREASGLAMLGDGEIGVVLDLGSLTS